MTKFMNPPFLAGMQAAQDGLPSSANPYPRSEPVQGDGYPGPYCNWRDGWTVGRAWMDFDCAQRKKGLQRVAGDV